MNLQDDENQKISYLEDSRMTATVSMEIVRFIMKNDLSYDDSFLSGKLK